MKRHRESYGLAFIRQPILKVENATVNVCNTPSVNYNTMRNNAVYFLVLFSIEDRGMNTEGIKPYVDDRVDWFVHLVVQ
jgi:hypothetical protein